MKQQFVQTANASDTDSTGKQFVQTAGGVKTKRTASWVAAPSTGEGIRKGLQRGFESHRAPETTRCALFPKANQTGSKKPTEKLLPVPFCPVPFCGGTNQGFG